MLLFTGLMESRVMNQTMKYSLKLYGHQFSIFLMEKNVPCIFDSNNYDQGYFLDTFSHEKEYTMFSPICFYRHHLKYQCQYTAIDLQINILHDPSLYGRCHKHHTPREHNVLCQLLWVYVLPCYHTVLMRNKFILCWAMILYKHVGLLKRTKGLLIM